LHRKNRQGTQTKGPNSLEQAKERWEPNKTLDCGQHDSGLTEKKRGDGGRTALLQPPGNKKRGEEELVPQKKKRPRGNPEIRGKQIAISTNGKKRKRSRKNLGGA